MRSDGTPAARFAIEHAHYSDDLSMWAALAAAHDGPVLDLGAAVGRVTRHLAQRGFRVTAVDNDPAMCDHLRSGVRYDETDDLVEVVCADCRTLDLGRRFALIIMPMNTMQVFVSPDDREAVLTTVRSHLEPGGEFVFDVAMADTRALSQVVGQIHHTATHHVGNDRVLVHSARYDAVDPDSGTTSFTLLIDDSTNGTSTRFERVHTVHIYDPSEIWELLSEFGFEVHSVYGDFDGSPLRDNSNHQIVRCGVAA